MKIVIICSSKDKSKMSHKVRWATPRF